MDIYKDFKDIVNADNLQKSANYYFETHECGGQPVKVMMDYKLSVENSDKIVKFGKCEQCGTLFYHLDYESRTV